MACNENIVKNIANEVTRNCQVHNVNVEPEFVMFLIDLLLMNPKYGKLFEKNLNRTNLEYFVNECVTMLMSGDLSLNTLKMQFVMLSNYNDLEVLIERHVKHVRKCLRPLHDEILDAEPDDEDEAAFKKLFRKISIYILLSSGLGNPAIVANLKESMAALESVYSVNELYLWVTAPRAEKARKIEELFTIVSGVRLFNRDCGKGGDMIPDLPLDLRDSAKALISLLSNSLMGVMQRVNMLTTAIEGHIFIDQSSGNVTFLVPPDSELTESHYRHMTELLLFNRQYEVYTRQLLSDAERTLDYSKVLVSAYESVLSELHTAVQFKNAVPCDVVFPMFIRLWEVWSSMQNTMYLVSTMNRLTTILGHIQDHMKIPFNILEIMLQGKLIVTDEERMSLCIVGTDYNNEEDQTDVAGAPLTMGQQSGISRIADSLLTVKVEKQFQYLGFCVMCLCQGALIASNLRLGQIQYEGRRYGFCNSRMATRFAKDPQRYINTLLDYARNNPQIITMLNIKSDVDAVRNVDPLIVKEEPKTKVFDKDIQTETHPIDNGIDRGYTWNLWEWKRRAMRMSTVVNCKTHSTQTYYSHLRADIQCQTAELRDKEHQTKKDVGVMTTMCQSYFWGLRGKKGEGQHVMDLRPPHLREKLKPKTLERCKDPTPLPTPKYSSAPSVNHEFYVPPTEKKHVSDDRKMSYADDDNDDLIREKSTTSSIKSIRGFNTEVIVYEPRNAEPKKYQSGISVESIFSR